MTMLPSANPLKTHKQQWLEGYPYNTLPDMPHKI